MPLLTIVPSCSSLDFHCDLHCFHHGLVTICSGVYVVGLGLPCAKHDQHHHPSLCQVCQLLQPAHLLRHELQIPQGRLSAAAVCTRAQGGGATAALSEHQTQGWGPAAACVTSRPQAGGEICSRGAEPVQSWQRLRGQQPSSDASIWHTGGLSHWCALTHRNIRVLVWQALKTVPIQLQPILELQGEIFGLSHVNELYVQPVLINDFLFHTCLKEFSFLQRLNPESKRIQLSQFSVT